MERPILGHQSAVLVGPEVFAVKRDAFEADGRELWPSHHETHMGLTSHPLIAWGTLANF